MEGGRWKGDGYVCVGRSQIWEVVLAMKEKEERGRDARDTKVNSRNIKKKEFQERGTQTLEKGKKMNKKNDWRVGPSTYVGARERWVGGEFEDKSVPVPTM